MRADLAPGRRPAGPRDELQLTWAAMGSTAEAVVLGPLPDTRRNLVSRLAELESRWSRFRPDSEVSLLNAGETRLGDVSGTTRALLAAGRRGWLRTGGRFDPWVLPAVEATGYTRSFADLVSDLLTAPGADHQPGRPHQDQGAARARRALPGDTSIPDAEHGSGGGPTPDLLRAQRGGWRAGFDPGGLGKGLAADLLVEWLLDEGAAGALVSVGGDMRIGGALPEPLGWGIQVDDVGGEELAFLAVSGGGIATSSPGRRRWQGTAGPVHHLIDPRTGLPAHTDVAQVTVLAGTAVQAEVLATAISVSGLASAPDLLAGEAAALVLTDDGTHHHLGGMEAHLR